MANSFGQLGERAEAVSRLFAQSSEGLAASFEAPLKEFVRTVRAVKKVMADRSGALAALQQVCEWVVVVRVCVGGGGGGGNGGARGAAAGWGGRPCVAWCLVPAAPLDPTACLLPWARWMGLAVDVGSRTMQRTALGRHCAALRPPTPGRTPRP